MSKFLDMTGLTHFKNKMINVVNSGLNKKVDKVTGKSLISDTEIARLAKVTNYDDSGVKADIQTNADNINTNKTNISTLKKYVTGDLLDSDFQEDSTVAMAKTVPTGMADYAAIKVIGGKTVKSKNLFKKYTNLNGYTVSSETYNGYPCITSSSAWLGAFDSSLILKSGVTYYVYAMVKSDLAGAIISVYGKNSEGNSVTLNSVTIGESNTWTRLHKVYTPSSDIIQLRIESRSEAKTTIAEFMVVESFESINYEPYFEGLHSAPVESVISVGKNIAEFSPMTEKAKMNIYGAIEKGKFLKAGKYTLSYQSDYTAFLQVWLVDNMTQIVKDGSAKTITFTLPSDGKYSIYFYKDTTSEGGLANANIRNLQLEKSNEATAYSRHFKTTLLIPDSIKSLPDYGVGIDPEHCNWIDFENMVYHHDYTLYDLTGKGWTSDGNGVFHTSYPTNAKVKAYGICNNYTVDYSSNTPHDVGDMIVRDPTYNVMYVKVESGTSPDTTGTLLYYELADDKKELIDISDMLHPIRVESGGTITFQNEHNLDTPNTVVYKKEVSLS